VMAALECAEGFIGQIRKARRVDHHIVIGRRRLVVGFNCWARTLAGVIVLPNCSRRPAEQAQGCKNENGKPGERHGSYSNLGAEASRRAFASAIILAGSFSPANTAAPTATKSAPVFATSTTEAMSAPARTIH